jgi:hypothetical protein
LKKYIGLVGMMIALLTLFGCGSNKSEVIVKESGDTVKVITEDQMTLKIPVEWKRYTEGNAVHYGGVISDMVSVVQITVEDTHSYANMDTIEDVYDGDVKTIKQNADGEKVTEEEWDTKKGTVKVYKYQEINSDNVPYYNVFVLLVKDDRLIKLEFGACSANMQPLKPIIKQADAVFKEAVSSISI